MATRSLERSKTNPNAVGLRCTVAFGGKQILIQRNKQVETEHNQQMMRYFLSFSQILCKTHFLTLNRAIHAKPAFGWIAVQQYIFHLRISYHSLDGANVCPLMTRFFSKSRTINPRKKFEPRRKRPEEVIVQRPREEEPIGIANEMQTRKEESKRKEEEEEKRVT